MSAISVFAVPAHALDSATVGSADFWFSEVLKRGAALYRMLREGFPPAVEKWQKLIWGNALKMMGFAILNFPASNGFCGFHIN